MYQWLDRSHPQVLQSAVFLGYLMAFFALLGASGTYAIAIVALGLALAAGAFGTASNKRWGYMLLAVAASVMAGLQVLDLLQMSFNVIRIPYVGVLWIYFLEALNETVFPVALAAAVLHRHSRDYQKIWFE